MFSQEVKGFSVDVASGVTISSALNLGGHTWDNIYVEIPSHASGGTHYIQASNEVTGNFHRLSLVDPADGGDNVIQILAPNGKVVRLPGGLGNVKIENTSGVTDSTMTYIFYCS